MALIVRRILCSSIFKATGLSNINVHESYVPRFLVTRNNCSLKCPDPPSFTTRLALPQDHDRIMALMCETFFKTEPSIVNIGLSGKVGPPLIHLVKESLKEGMTIVAISSDNCIVGAAINKGSCPWDPKRTIEFANCCECRPTKELLKFFAYISMQPQLWQKFCVLKIFDCGYVTVAEEYQGMGIAKKLIQESWYLARDCGYRLFRIDCSSRYSAKIAENFGWTCVYSLPYSNYIVCDEQVFKYVQSPHTEVKVFVDEVTYCKDYCQPYPKCKKKTKAPVIQKKK